MYIRRVLVVVVFIVISWFALSALRSYLDPNTVLSEEELEEEDWIATSAYWLDRIACRWIGLCGLAHYRPEPAWQQRKRRGQEPLRLNSQFRGGKPVSWGVPPPSGKLKPEDFDDDKRVLKDVPQFVLDHAPLIHLYSGEQFWPSDIAEHLLYTAPAVNHTSTNTTTQYGLHNLEGLHNISSGRYLYMKSVDDVEDRPTWLGSAYNKPIPYPDLGDDDEEEVHTYTELVESDAKANVWFDAYAPSKRPSRPRTPEGPHRSLTMRSNPQNKPDAAGRSTAPAILILVDKGNHTIDAFWFYFYSYNLGTTVLNIRFGNHVGDWEHSLIRFYKGVPESVFFSAHSGGTAYTYNSVEKGRGKGREGRPVLYSAVGSHAMYAMPGKHPYVLPFGLLADITDKGPLWDPTLNYYAYHFNTSLTHDVDAKVLLPNPAHGSLSTQALRSLQVHHSTDSFVPASHNPNAPTSWFWFKGHWGDKFYELADERQWRFAGEYHYVNGPLGPRYKNLGRARVCQSGKTCRMLDSIEDGKKSSWINARSLVIPEEGLVDIDPDIE